MRKICNCMVMTLICMGLFGFSINVCAKNNKNATATVAVVVDCTTYKTIQKAVDNYVEHIKVFDNKQNLIKRGVLVLDKWGQPDSIRACLLKLYEQDNLEGAVFVGDIPIPMVRGAHHLATAFKMNPKRDWKESSIPSDRFYDCFSLKFNFLKQDEDNKLLFYYLLAPESRQSVLCDIYSARIKAPIMDGETKYETIERYLNKAVEIKEQQGRMNKILYFAGHGYNSESFNAKIDEGAALNEQFPFLSQRRGASLNYIDFTFDKSIKRRLLSALSDSSLDLAILHHHGSEDTQYLNGSPYVSDPKSWIELAKNYFRGKVRRAKDTTLAKTNFVEEYDIPESWVDNSTSRAYVLKDSLYSAGMDISIPDLKGYVSGSKIVILDACFNGAFNNDDYIAAHHAFSKGNTVVVKANSVNTLQDTWTNQLMGILDYGVCVGNWGKGQMTIESHFIGDPTFSFYPDKYPFLDEAVVKEKNNPGYWRKLLKSNDTAAELEGLSIKMLHRMGAIESKKLLEYLKNSPSRVVRLMAFDCLAERADNCLVDALKLGMTDSYELLQRLATKIAGKNGSPQLLELAAEKLLDPNTSVRVNFQLKTLIDILNNEAFLKELEKQHLQNVKREPGDSFHWPSDTLYEQRIAYYKRCDSRQREDYKKLFDKNTAQKQLNFVISGERNACNPAALEGFYYLLSEDSFADSATKIAVAEAIGWYRYSYKKNDIIKRCSSLYSKEKDKEVKAELLKTINRLNLNNN